MLENPPVFIDQWDRPGNAIGLWAAEDKELTPNQFTKRLLGNNKRITTSIE
jgi:hypothetical protein